MTIEFYKIDFTDVLPKTYGSTIFNPSVCHWKDNLYLCLYREFIRYPNTNIEKFSKNPLTNPNHPWLGSYEAWPLWWKTLYGHDKSRIVLISIDEDLDVRVIIDYGSFYGIDGRLLKIEKNKFLFTHNMWVENKKIRIKNNKNCEDGCMLMGIRILTLKNLSLDKGTFNVLCPSISNWIEKNWSFWKDDGKLKFSYGLSPKHQIFTIKYKGKYVKCEKPKNIISGKSYFYKLEKYYDNNIYVSLSTPALLQPNGKYLSVGHIKYKYKDFDTKSSLQDPEFFSVKTDRKFSVKMKHKNTKLVKFHNKMVKHKIKFHPVLVYMMFIYEFEPSPPYNITRISPMFIPGSEYALCFPVGLTYSDSLKSYIISYGDHDTRCDMIVMTKEEINASLGPIPSPKDTKFLMV